MLRAVALLLLAGCDLVLGLDRPAVTDDDDGDGVRDEADPCPHLADESSTDADQDGISVDCDLDDSVATANRLFWTFRDGERPLELPLVSGSAFPDRELDAIILGQRSEGLSALVLDVATDTALIDVGFVILENAIEDDVTTEMWTEIGVFAVHREFTLDRQIRGDNCYIGNNPPPSESYLELNEDAQSRNTPRRFPGPLNGLAGRLRVKRNPTRLDCVLKQTTGLETSDGFAVDDKTRVGKIAITTERLRARLSYVWITYQ